MTNSVEFPSGSVAGVGAGPTGDCSATGSVGGVTESRGVAVDVSGT